MFSLATCLAEILLMAEILHLLIGSSSQYLQGSIYYISQVVQDFSQQQ